MEAVSDRVFPGKLIRADYSGRALGRLGSDIPEDRLGTTLLGVVKLLYPTLPQDFVRPPAVVGYVALLDRLKAAVEARPADLGGLAAVCRADGTGPGALVVAVIQRLTEALRGIEAEAATLPDHTPAPTQAPMQRVRRAAETEPATSGTSTVVPGFVLKD